jgi:hypothetical protein
MQPGLLAEMPILPDGVLGAKKKREHPKAKKVNPMLAIYGAGPAEAICRDCTHLRVKEWAGRYYKCVWRGNTNGPGTDHRVRWPACGKFEASA